MLVLLGGDGFIGRHTTVRACQRGIPVTVVARKPAPEFLERNAPSAQSMPLEHFLGAAGDRLLSQATALVHLAGRSVPGSHVDAPQREFVENVGPAFEVFLRVARLRPALPIVFLSSGGAVYGRNECDRIPESEPVKPISPYALGKVLTEQCLVYCGETVGQSYAILRASNVIGRWHRRLDQGLAPTALRAIRSGGALDVYGDGSAVRDYIDADDLAEAIIAVATADEPVQDVWNVGSGIGRSVLDVISAVAAAAGGEARLNFKPHRGVDVPRSVLDASRFMRKFGWRPHISFEESIRRLVQADEGAL